MKKNKKFIKIRKDGAFLRKSTILSIYPIYRLMTGGRRKIIGSEVFLINDEKDESSRIMSDRKPEDFIRELEK